MISNIQLKVIVRGWFRNKVYFVIALLSLVMGLTCSLLLVGFVGNEYRIANQVEDGGQLFLVQEYSNFRQDKVIENNGSSKGMAYNLKNYYPEVKGFCVFHEERGDYFRNGEKKPIEFMAVTAEFPEFFRPKVVAGDLKRTLASPDQIAVTSSYAMQQFGRVDVIGETMHISYSRVPLEEKWGMEEINQVYTITSVIDDSEEHFLNYKILIRLGEECLVRNGAAINRYYSFLKLDPAVNREVFAQKVTGDSTVWKSKYYYPPQIRLIPMNQVYFTDEQGEKDELIVTRNRGLLFIGLSIAIAVLLLACFNYINISMTRTLQRMKNVGQQMVFGATKGEMQVSLVMETAIQVVLAFGIALGLLYQILPLFNGFMDARLTLGGLFVGNTLWAVIGLLVLVTLLPSWYIFSHLSRETLYAILKQEYRQRSRLITGMVITQFFVALVLLITVLNIHAQMNFIGHIRQDADRIYVISLLAKSERWDAFCTRLNEIPGVEAITVSSPLGSGTVGKEGKLLNLIFADDKFYDFYHLDFVAGEAVRGEVEGYKNIVVNEAMVREFGLQEPVGYQMDFNGKYRITGVVRDFPIDNFSEKIQPLAIEASEGGWQVCVKMHEKRIDHILQEVKKLWREIEPLGVPIQCKTMVQVYEDLHLNEQRLLKIVWIFTWISIILTCLGLFGLAWFAVEKRRKEIGIRKVNGATEFQIIVLLCTRFVKWIAWAFVLAVPVAYWLVQQWMMQFVYRVGLQEWTFLLAGLWIVLVGILTVIWQSWRAALVNPVEVIKAD